MALLARDWLLEDFGPNLDVEGRSRTDLSQCLQRAYLFIHFSLSLRLRLRLSCIDRGAHTSAACVCAQSLTARCIMSQQDPKYSIPFRIIQTISCLFKKKKKIPLSKKRMACCAFPSAPARPSPKTENVLMRYSRLFISGRNKLNS